MPNYATTWYKQNKRRLLIFILFLHFSMMLLSQYITQLLKCLEIISSPRIGMFKIETEFQKIVSYR